MCFFLYFFSFICSLYDSKRPWYVSLRVFSVSVFLWHTQTASAFKYIFIFLFLVYFFDSNILSESIGVLFLMSQYLVQSKYLNADAIAFGSFNSFDCCSCAHKFYRFNIWLDLLWLWLRYATRYFDVLFYFMIRFAQLCITSMLPMLYSCVNVYVRVYDDDDDDEDDGMLLWFWSTHFAV